MARRTRFILIGSTRRRRLARAGEDVAEVFDRATKTTTTLPRKLMEDGNKYHSETVQRRNALYAIKQDAGLRTIHAQNVRERNDNI